jgi:hypothetical protein
MNAEEINKLVDSGDLDPIWLAETLSFNGSSLNQPDPKPMKIGSFAVVPLERVDESWAYGDHDMTGEDGLDLGCLVHPDPSELIAWNSLSDYRMAAALCGLTTIQYKQPAAFTMSYMVIKIDQFQEFVTSYLSGMPVWGGMIHRWAAGNPLAVKRNLCKGLKSVIPLTEEHEMALIRAVNARHPFDRYLHLYHQFELLFDVVWIQKLKSAPSTAAALAVLRDMQNEQSELERLTAIFKQYVNGSEIIPKMAAISKFEATAKLLFDEHGSVKNNPVPLSKRIEFWTSLSTGTPERCLDSVFSTNKIAEKRNEAALRVVSYWIYRVRCCVAHKRDGLYVLSESDHTFVLEAMEPLLRAAVASLSRNQDLKVLLGT